MHRRVAPVKVVCVLNCEFGGILVGEMPSFPSHMFFYSMVPLISCVEYIFMLRNGCMIFIDPIRWVYILSMI